MKFNSTYNHGKTIPMPKCDPIQIQYDIFTNEDGIEYYKEVDRLNVYEKIQESKDGVLLSKIIDAYKPKIDEYDLTKLNKLAVMDYTKTPTNLIDAMNFLKEQHIYFDSMPLEIKLKFNNSFEEFIAGANNGTLKSLLEKYNKKPEKKKIISKVEQANTLKEQIEKATAKLNELQGANNNVN